MQQSRLVNFWAFVCSKLSVYADGIFATGLAFIRHVFSETQTVARRSHVLVAVVVSPLAISSHHGGMVDDRNHFIGLRLDHL